MKNLTIPVCRIYFEQIKSGEKREEFRLQNEYWSKRLVGKQYHNVVITCGYPKKTDFEKRIAFAWCGYVRKNITHPHFGDMPVDVFAIRLEK